MSLYQRREYSHSVDSPDLLEEGTLFESQLGHRVFFSPSRQIQGISIRKYPVPCKSFPMHRFSVIRLIFIAFIYIYRHLQRRETNQKIAIPTGWAPSQPVMRVYSKRNCGDLKIMHRENNFYPIRLLENFVPHEIKADCSLSSFEQCQNSSKHKTLELSGYYINHMYCRVYV